MLNCSDEGVIIKTTIENKTNTYLKIQTYPYQFHKAIGLEKNILKEFDYRPPNNASLLLLTTRSDKRR